MNETNDQEIKDEVIEQIYTDIKEIRKDIETNRAMIEAAIELLMDLRKRHRTSMDHESKALKESIMDAGDK